MRGAGLGVVVLLGLAAAAAGAWDVLTPGDGFPHDEHGGLFPTCLGCHRGVPEGDSAEFYSVEPAECARCHDGERLDRVEWREPSRAPGNLIFSHPEHARDMGEVGQEPLACQGCHGLPGAEARMAVTEAAAGTCLDCHAHRADRHLVDAECSTCHQPLARAGALTTAAIRDFPAPPDHQAEDFLFDHGEDARAPASSCAVCHARQSCARCHLNAGDVEAIASLAPDERVASLVADEAGEWPVPPGHRREDWWRTHGVAAREAIEGCATCHAATSCTACHGASPPPVVARLPRPGPGEPQGVRVASVRPPSHDPVFLRNHGSAAAVGLSACSSCHAESECADCHVPAGVTASGSRAPAAAPATARRTGRATLAHAGGAVLSAAAVRFAGATRGADPGLLPPAGADAAADTTDEQRDPEERADTWPWPRDPGEGFHPPDFVLRHGAEAFAAREECAECHAREATCRSCHEALGIAATSRRTSGGAFHDGRPAWLISHGQAARQNLEACASCHRQSSCLRCHSARTGLRVSPHGPGFDPDRVGERSLLACSICHFRGQLSPP